MTLKRNLTILKLAILCLLASCGGAFAVEDGFVATQEIGGTYFTVYGAQGVDIPALTAQLGVGATDALLAGQKIGGEEYLEQGFTQAMDTFFIRVCDILDMRLYSFQGKIKICLNQDELGKLYLRLYQKRLDPAIQAFYSHGLNTVYASQAGVTRSILGHEVAHAVMSHYFVVLPSYRIQEVLAGYVEYQLRKEPLPSKLPK